MAKEDAIRKKALKERVKGLSKIFEFKKIPYCLRSAIGIFIL